MLSQITQGILLMKDLYVRVLQNCVCFLFKYAALDLWLWRKAHKDTRNLGEGKARQELALNHSSAEPGSEPCLWAFSNEQ